jgi:hypothetical protein
VKIHSDLVLARFRSVVPLASKTFVAPAQRSAAGVLPVPPYAVIYPAAGTDSSDRLAGPLVDQHPRFTAHIVGSSYDVCDAVLALVKAKFIVNGVGIEAVIAGEKSSGMFFNSPQPIQVDYDISPPLVYATVELGWNSSPTA